MENIPGYEYMPIPPFVEGNPSKLIIGTFPPHKSQWNYAFFFPNNQNRLWNVLGKVAYGDEYTPQHSENNDNAVKERKQILRVLDCAMVNIIKECIRKEKSALDNNLEVLKLHNILGEILSTTPSINTIYLTSASGKNSCLSLFKNHLKENNIRLKLHQPVKKDRAMKIKNPLYCSFIYDNREINVFSLYSPSPTSSRAGITVEILIEQYKIIGRDRRF